jgi:hypothetical protein
MIHDRRAQSAMWGLLLFLVLILAAGVVVDVYELFTIRNWAYSVAQEAALSGVSRGRDWATGTVPNGGGSPAFALVSAAARTEALTVVASEMAVRGVVGYQVDVRILADSGGGTTPGYPPHPVRLGGSGDWSSAEPAVGVYLEVPVQLQLLNFLGLGVQTVHVFAAAGVHQP